MNMPTFEHYIGIDYSGARDPEARLPGLRVYRAERETTAEEVTTPGPYRHWTRKGIAEWLIEQLQSKKRIIAGLDHAFSFPMSYMERYGLETWDAFLTDFRRHWPTHEQWVETLRKGSPRTGEPIEYRLTDRWTSSAKSVFLFDVSGSVAKSTHAGLPWLLHIRETLGDRVFFWPFDGWTPPADKHVLAEIYPSIYRNRYRCEGLTGDQRDAYAATMWLKEMDERNALFRFFDPPLAPNEKRIAAIEGWILGVM